MSSDRLKLQQPLFSFGVISDIQYADIDDAMNFSQTESRCYRGTLQHTKTAVQFWNAMTPELSFIAQLGDLIDGQNNGTYGQGLQFTTPQTQHAFNTIIGELQNCRAPMYHVIGNHELYNFTWDELRQNLNICAQRYGEHSVAKEEFYYTFHPYEGWKFIVLNPYEISVIQSEEYAGYQQAVKTLTTHNPNYSSKKDHVDYFAGLHGVEQRFVPFNGGLGQRQLAWLQETVITAHAKGERVVVLSHLPMYHPAADAQNLAYDYDQVLRILRSDGRGCVVAVIAGHCHKGGYSLDETGIHHITLQSPLTHGECFGYVDVHSDRLELIGVGALPSYTLKFVRH